MENSFAIAVLLIIIAALLFVRYLRLAGLLRKKHAILKQVSSGIKNGALSEAEDLLDGTKKEFKNDPAINYLYGYIRYSQNRPAEALALFLAAERSRDPRVLYSSGYLYFHNEEDPGESMKRLVKASGRGAAALRAGYTLGLLNYVMGNTKSAERIILRALAAGADNEAEIDNALGLISLRENDPGGAILRFKASIRQNDGVPDTYLNLAEAHAAKHERAEELAMLERAERLHPGNKHIRLKLGEILAANGKIEEALVHLTAAIELDPGFSLAYFSRAGVYKKTREADKYRIDYEKALACRRRNPHDF